MAEMIWWFMIFKLTYFVESINYALSKNHLNALYYVSHHASIPICIWFLTKFLPGGHSTFFGLINSFIHIIILSYYVLIGFLPKIKERTKNYWPMAYTIIQVSLNIYFEVDKCFSKDIIYILNQIFLLLMPQYIFLLLQIVHFVILYIHTFQLFFWNDCNFPMGFVYGVSLQAVILFVLFIMGLNGFRNK